MPAYIPITESETDPGAPGTSELWKKWRDNPIAVAEADPTAPQNLLPTVLIGSATLTGATTTISGLVLQPYKFLKVVMNGISGAATATELLINATTVARLDLLPGGNNSAVYNLFPEIELSSGLCNTGNFTRQQAGVFDTANGLTRTIGITNASTSIGFSLVGTTFDAGTVRLYGCK